MVRTSFQTTKSRTSLVTTKRMKLMKKRRALSSYPWQYQGFLQALHGKNKLSNHEEPNKLSHHEAHEAHEEAESSVFLPMAVSVFPSSASW